MASICALTCNNPQKIIDDIDCSFQLSTEKLLNLVKAFLDEFQEGLKNYGHPMAMIPTFITGVPDGSEKGTFLALDLGGTNIRVCQVVLHGDRTFSLRQQKYKINEALKCGEASALFDYLADSVDAFLTTHAPSAYTGAEGQVPDVVCLGLTFSFPVEQTALDSGRILTWTKGFSAKNAIGRDVVELLQEAFDRKHLHVKCVALVNDTVGTLLTRAYTSGGCILGAILGTGTNGAYVEHVAKIGKLKESLTSADATAMVINCEWGAFNNARTHLPSTPFDNALDRLSINHSYQAFEKFISGMYLGEISRNILTSLIDAVPKSLLFNGKSTRILNTHYGLDTSVMSEIERAWEGLDSSSSVDLFVPSFKDFDATTPPNIISKLQRVRQVVIKDFDFRDVDVTLRDAAIVRWACAIVAHRAAYLSGVAIAAVLFQTNNASFVDDDGRFPPRNDVRNLNIGLDGSLIEHYPKFESMLRESLRILVGDQVEKAVELGLAKDGSGVGAAICALQASRQ